MSNCWLLLILMLPLSSPDPDGQDGSEIPQFGRDTVLVYRNSVEPGSDLVVRVAEFLPDRFIEWEDSTTQGTIYLTAKAVAEGRDFVTSQLFQGGVNTREKNKTTLWLSVRMFRQLKAGRKVKLSIDGLPTAVEVLGSGRMEVEVNRARRMLPVLKILDERGNERWFLDDDANPMLVRHTVRNYEQKLISITTDRPNTLRWIKRKGRP
jgi:hypothetical protein